jgi:1,4-alpha-glucan branching enzyme
MLRKRFFKTKDECEVAFEWASAGARQVALVCEANGWRPIAMKRAKEGPFKTRLRLPKQREFQFRYLVDDQSWVNDADADGYRPNAYGGVNGVVSTSPPAA